MKLPRYLLIALLISCALSFYALLSDNEVKDFQPTQVKNVYARPQIKAGQAAASELSKKNTDDNFVDLFPSAIKPVLAVKQTIVAMPKISQSPEVTTPILPFALMGAWWADHQRVLLLKGNNKSWVLCGSCRVEGRIWIGMQLTDNWQLKNVSADRLTFVWLPQMREQNLDLGDLKFEPKFNHAK